MSCAEIPDDVQALLHDHIESYEQLEILLLLRREIGEPWTAERISERLGISAALAADALGSLRSSRLVKALQGQPETRYAYAPVRVALHETVNRLESDYASRPIEIIKLMSANAVERVRTGALRMFAEAFVLRKDKDDG
jgi:DNA-binding IscR family transcriptional regulator